jgi:hypothetical protein
MDFVVTRNATTNVWRVARPRKVAVLTAFVDRLRMTRILTMIVRTVHVTGKTNAKITMGIRVDRRRNVYPIIVSMDIVAEISAWGLVKPVVRRKKAVAAMAFAEILLRLRIRTMNAILANVREQARVMRVLSLLRPMVRLVPRRRNVRLGFVPTEFVVIAGV